MALLQGVMELLPQPRASLPQLRAAGTEQGDVLLPGSHGSVLDLFGGIWVVEGGRCWACVWHLVVKDRAAGMAPIRSFPKSSSGSNLSPPLAKAAPIRDSVNKHI